jgi:hypothetical protein
MTNYTAQYKAINQIDVNTNYSLIYETDMETTNHSEMTFSGQEMLNALGNFLMHQEQISQDATLEEDLNKRIEIWGRIVTGKPLTNAYPEKTIKFIKCALNGCKDCMDTLRNEFACYLIFRIECLLEHGLLFVVDSDCTGEVDSKCDCSVCISEKLQQKH